MNMQYRDPGAREPDRTAPTRRIPLLARLSGRDRTTLARCPTDAIAQSSSLGAVLLVAALLHAAGVIAALVILNVPLELAAAVAAVTATGLFAMDRIVVTAVDTAGAERALRRAGATDLPTLSSRWHGAIMVVLRNLFSVFTAVFVGGALVLYFYATDAAQELDRRQIVIDTPLVAEAEALLDSERAALLRARAQEEAVATQRAGRLAERAAARQAQEATAADDVARTREALVALQSALRSARAEAAQHRDRMACERHGGRESCPGATGLAGRGTQYNLARDRAEAAEAEADRIAADIPAAERALREAQSRLDSLHDARAEDDDPRDGGVVAAAQALAAFDASRTARAAELVAANPLREVIDHGSLANRLSALRSLAEQDTAFLLSVMAVKLFAFALEMLAIIAAHVMSRSEYHLLRGRLLADAGRIARNAYRQSYMEDAGLRATFRKQAWDEARDEMAGDIFFRSMSTAKSGEPVRA